MAQGGPIPGPAVRNTPPDLNDFGLVVRVVSGGGVGVLVQQGTIPWIVSDPPVEAALNVTLSTRASEASLLVLNALVAAGFDVPLSTRASEATLTTRASEATLAAGLNVPLSTRASEATVAAISVNTANLDVPLSTRASEVTLATRASEVTLVTRASEATLITRASEATLATRASEATLATRASEATLLTRLADATFTARINTLGQKLMVGSTPVVIASDQTAVPISAAALPLPAGAATEVTLATRLADATFTSRINTLGQKLMAASTPVVLASDQTVIPVSDNGGSLTIDTPQLPAALVGGRLDENLGAWLGSTAPTVGQKVMASSVPVVIASDQSSVSTSIIPFGGVRGLAGGRVVGVAATLQALLRTTYNQPTVNAQRSISSTAATDTGAGVGAQQVTITYFDATMAGPFTETVTLNGVAAVNTVGVNICFIEKMVVTRVGGSGSNAGTITLFNAVGGGGGTLAVLGFASLVAGRGDNATLWAHHYVATGKTCNITSWVFGTAQNQGASSALMALNPVVATSPEILIADELSISPSTQSVYRPFEAPVQAVGPSRITQYAIPLGSNTVFTGGFVFWDQ